MDTSSVQDILGKIFDLLGLPYTKATITLEEDLVRVDIDSPQASRMIGWHGETLNSVQHILKAIIRSQQKLDHNPFILLDVDGYRRMQEDKVRKVTEQKADFVRRTGSRIALAPMSPYFRRIVHLYVANTPSLNDLTTESTGEGDYRQVVLRLKQEKRGARTKVSEPSEELSPVITENDGLDNLDV